MGFFFLISYVAEFREILLSFVFITQPFKINLNS